jgi:hypothetical protein
METKAEGKTKVGSEEWCFSVTEIEIGEWQVRLGQHRHPSQHRKNLLPLPILLEGD